MAFIVPNIPKVLKNFRVYIDGFDTGNNVSEITLPKITQKIEELKLGRFTLPVSMGLEKLECELTFYEISLEFFAQWGLLNNSAGQLVSFRGYQEQNEKNSNMIQIEMRGIFSEVDLGAPKRGEASTHKVVVALTQFTYRLDNLPVLVIEPLTNTFIINGVNQLAKEKEALGLI